MKSEPSVILPPDRMGRVREQLCQNERIRLSLAEGGRLHIDRQLPFLCVYRRPWGRPDPGTEKLVLGEASYLIASARRRLHPSLTALVASVAKENINVFGAFLILEVWAAADTQAGTAEKDETSAPAFCIYAPREAALKPTVDQLQKSLRRVRIGEADADVRVERGARPFPPGLPDLISPAESAEFTVDRIGLEVKPIYRDPDTGEIYPAILRRLQSQMVRALRQGLYEYTRTRTTHLPPHYHALGRRAMVKAVWEVDGRLAGVGSAFDLLLGVTPMNPEEAWAEFRRSGFERTPEFVYRPLPIEPPLLKRKLYEIPLERIEDPALGQLFREKQEELDRMITMLADRDTRRFLWGSLQLFGQVEDDLLSLARDLLQRLPSRDRSDSVGVYIEAPAFAEHAAKEIDYYRSRHPEFSASVSIRSDVPGLLVSRGELLIGAGARVPEARVEAALQHEVGTHLLTYFNGKAQPFQQLYCGLAGYDELQEGLAVFSEYMVGGLTRRRLRLLAARVLAAHRISERVGFVDIFRELDRDYDFGRREAFQITTRAYRGGGLTKDASYLRGLVRLHEFLRKGGDIELLFVGKIHFRHIPIIQELRWREILREPPLKPRYLRQANSAKMLARLRQSDSLYDLVEEGHAK